jgi:hypothetical protein
MLSSDALVKANDLRTTSLDKLQAYVFIVKPYV